jgi:hypothetical protein
MTGTSFYLDLQEKLKETRAMGMPVLHDLARLERDLEADFSCGRT